MTRAQEKKLLEMEFSIRETEEKLKYIEERIKTCENEQKKQWLQTVAEDMQKSIDSIQTEQLIMINEAK